jgi:hypothetical protein
VGNQPPSSTGLLWRTRSTVPLGVDAAADLGEVPCVRAEEIVQAGESSWLIALGLEPTVRTWSSYPDD